MELYKSLIVAMSEKITETVKLEIEARFIADKENKKFTNDWSKKILNEVDLLRSLVVTNFDRLDSQDALLNKEGVERAQALSKYVDSNVAKLEENIFTKHESAKTLVSKLVDQLKGHIDKTNVRFVKNEEKIESNLLLIQRNKEATDDLIEKNRNEMELKVESVEHELFEKMENLSESINNELDRLENQLEEKTLKLKENLEKQLSEAENSLLDKMGNLKLETLQKINNVEYKLKLVSDTQDKNTEVIQKALIQTRAKISNYVNDNLSKIGDRFNLIVEDLGEINNNNKEIEKVLKAMKNEISENIRIQQDDLKQSISAVNIKLHTFMSNVTT